MRVTLLTAASAEYWELLCHSAPNKLMYCLRWGLQFSMRQHRKFEPWGEREEFMLTSLAECDWLWFMGADTLIMNQQLDVRQLLDDRYDFIIGVDIHGINNDVFFLRNTERSRRFLERTLELRDSHPNDQSAMRQAMDEVPGLSTCLAHQRVFNSYPYSEYQYPDDGGGSYQHGDFVVHLPGLPNTRRIELMRKYLEQVIH